MKFEKNITDIIKERKSVRNYEDKNLSQIDKEKFLPLIDDAHNPFEKKLKVVYLERDKASNGEKLGKYGIIKGAKSFIGISTKYSKENALAVGYQFEEILLKATEIGLGTVWLAAMFSKEQFASYINIKNDEAFFISPIGYPVHKKPIAESLMKRTIKSTTLRKSWNNLFFENDFNNVLNENNTDSFKQALENLRLAPSALNDQPWRVVRENDTYHFFVNYKDDISEAEKFIKYVDLGIGICHFHLTLKEHMINGCFEKKEIIFDIPKNTYYVISWAAN